MSAEQAAADDTSRSPDCVVELGMDRFRVQGLGFRVWGLGLDQS